MTNLDAEKTLHQIICSIADASISEEPSPNIYVSDILPPTVYESILRSLPSDQALDFLDHPDAHAVDGRRTRKLLGLTHDTVERFQPDDIPLWRELVTIFTSKKLCDAIVDKFRLSLDARFPEGIPELAIVPIFYRDFPGYRISIHPDTASKVATFQLFLPQDDSQKHLGTTFHKSTDDGFIELKTFPFLPNSGYAFVRTEESWHSVKELGGNEATRNSIALTVYLRGQEYISPPRPTRIEEELAALGMGDLGAVDTPSGALRYMARGSAWRFESLLSKEPETIEWIDGFDPGDVLWDIGANVGIYSLYAALRGHKVIAFEPHFANYFQLCANIILNAMQENVTSLCLALSDKKKVSTINLAKIIFGSALSSFGNDLDFRGRPYDIAFRQGMLGYDLDNFSLDFQQPIPQHIKIDVDGIELDIVCGAKLLLARPDLKSVSIELVDTDEKQVTGVLEVMASCGLEFVHKKQNPVFNHTPTGDVLNFLFRRPDPRATKIASFSHRDELSELLPVGGVGAELGVAAGAFSESLLQRSALGFLYSIDMWAGDRGHDVEQYRAAVTRLRPYRERSGILRMRFDEALPLFEDESFDFIYVDGYAHTGEDGGRTFADWWPKVKPGGIFGGHDYHADWPKTLEEVDRFVARWGLKLYVLNDGPADRMNSRYPSWIVFKPSRRVGA